MSNFQIFLLIWLAAAPVVSVLMLKYDWNESGLDGEGNAFFICLIFVFAPAALLLHGLLTINSLYGSIKKAEEEERKNNTR